MSLSRWIECISGLLAGCAGALIAGLQFFGPGVTYRSGFSDGSSSGGITSYVQSAGIGNVIPLLILFGLPLLGIVLGAWYHAVRRLAFARLILLLSTLMLLALTGLTLLTIGPALLPSLACALLASAMALVNRQPLTSS